jgi:hypothetical protein
MLIVAYPNAFFKIEFLEGRAIARKKLQYRPSQKWMICGVFFARTVATRAKRPLARKKAE